MQKPAELRGSAVDDVSDQRYDLASYDYAIEPFMCNRD
jgi:hypothetical protein